MGLCDPPWLTAEICFDSSVKKCLTRLNVAAVASDSFDTYCYRAENLRDFRICDSEAIYKAF